MSQARSFVIERPLDEGDLFVGRFSELLTAAQQVKRGRTLLFVFGARRSGVTSFLNHLQTELVSRVRVLRAETTGHSADPDAVLALVSAAVEQVNAPAGSNPETGAVRGQSEQAGETPQRCVVLLDCLPVTALYGDRGEQWVSAILSYLQPRPWLQLVAAIRGCRPRDGGLLSPRASNVPAVELVGLTLEETEQLLTSGGDRSLRFEFDAMRRIWQFTSGGPYFVQLFGRVLEESHRGGVRVSAHVVEEALPVVLERGGAALEAMWADCSMAAQAILAVSNELPGRHGTFSRNDVLNAARRYAASLKEDVADRALSELETEGILERLGRGTYRHTLELFRLWGTKNRPLEQLLGRSRDYRRVLGAGSSVLSRFTWPMALGWGGLIAALFLVIWLWNARQPAAIVGRQTPTATSLLATRPPVLPGTAQGWITYMARPNPDAPWDVWLMRGDGSDPKRLTDDGANNQTPCWSPDGRLIAFVSDRDGNKEIHIIKADGTTPLNLTHHPAEDWTPAWSPDGSTIAFSSYRDGNWELYLMDANGANPRRLTHNPAADYAPSWSPDGERLVFQSNRDGNWELYVIGKDGKGLQRLTEDEATDSAPAWSPDGKWIAFESYRDGNMEIYLMAADGSEVQNLTQDQYANDHGPAWARAGTRILYYSNRDGGWDIYSMRVDGTDRENLTLNPALEQRPNWHE